MNVKLVLHEEPCEWPDLVSELERYVAQVTAEWTDATPASGVAQGLLQRANSHSAGLLVTAHGQGSEDPSEQRLGFCVVVPREDPLTGIELPFIAALEVDRNYRHRGLARSMVGAATTEMKSRGFSMLAARAGHNDDALISMGERWGFVRSHEIMLLES